MWPFDRARTARIPESGVRSVESVAGEDRLAGLRDDVAKLAKRLDSVEMEWAEWFDKFRRLYARIAKRQERDEVAEAAQTDKQSRQDAPGHANGVRAVSGGPRPRGNY